MTDFFDAVETLERTLCREHGPFDLFALVLRTRGHGEWDLVAAADWLDAGDARARRDFAAAVADRLADEHLLRLSRAAVVAPESDVARAFQWVQQKGHASSMLNHSGAFNFEIKDAYIITAGQTDSDEALSGEVPA